jgi:hypothetical protein
MATVTTTKADRVPPFQRVAPLNRRGELLHRFQQSLAPAFRRVGQCAHYEKSVTFGFGMGEAIRPRQQARGHDPRRMGTWILAPCQRRGEVRPVPWENSDAQVKACALVVAHPAR